MAALLGVMQFLNGYGFLQYFRQMALQCRYRILSCKCAVCTSNTSRIAGKLTFRGSAKAVNATPRGTNLEQIVGGQLQIAVGNHDF